VPSAEELVKLDNEIAELDEELVPDCPVPSSEELVELDKEIAELDEELVEVGAGPRLPEREVHASASTQPRLVPQQSFAVSKMGADWSLCLESEQGGPNAGSQSLTHFSAL